MKMEKTTTTRAKAMEYDTPPIPVWYAIGMIAFALLMDFLFPDREVSDE